MEPLPADILLVDDDPAVRDSFREVLEEEGFRVMMAQHGLEALDLLRHMPLPRLIILDLMMPVMDGWSFLEAQRLDSVLRTIPVVVLSARVLSDREAEQLGIGLYLRKPINLVSLLMIVESYCRPGADDVAREAEV